MRQIAFILALIGLAESGSSQSFLLDDGQSGVAFNLLAAGAGDISELDLFVGYAPGRFGEFGLGLALAGNSDGTMFGYTQYADFHLVPVNKPGESLFAFTLSESYLYSPSEDYYSSGVGILTLGTRLSIGVADKDRFPAVVSLGYQHSFQIRTGGTNAGGFLLELDYVNQTAYRVLTIGPAIIVTSNSAMIGIRLSFLDTNEPKHNDWDDF